MRTNVKTISSLRHGLRPFIQECGGINIFHSPHLVTVYYGQPDIANKENDVINRLVRTKKAKYVSRVQEGRFKEALMLVERPYRLHYFMRLFCDMAEHVKWELADWIWRDLEHGIANRDSFLSVFSVHGNPSLNIQAFKELPDEIEVYQISSDMDYENKNSLSLRWYTSKRKAQSEAESYFAASLLIGKVKKDKVLHVVERACGFELVINPIDVDVRAFSQD